MQASLPVHELTKSLGSYGPFIYYVFSCKGKLSRKYDGFVKSPKQEMRLRIVKFIFSKKATKIDKIFTVDLTFTTYCQINGEDLIKFCVLLRKSEL